MANLQSEHSVPIGSEDQILFLSKNCRDREVCLTMTLIVLRQTIYDGDHQQLKCQHMQIIQRDKKLGDRRWKNGAWLHLQWLLLWQQPFYSTSFGSTWDSHPIRQGKTRLCRTKSCLRLNTKRHFTQERHSTDLFALWTDQYDPTTLSKIPTRSSRIRLTRLSLHSRSILTHTVRHKSIMVWFTQIQTIAQLIPTTLNPTIVWLNLVRKTQIPLFRSSNKTLMPCFSWLKSVW
jgi:hypothetical protein